MDARKPQYSSSSCHFTPLYDELKIFFAIVDEMYESIFFSSRSAVSTFFFFGDYISKVISVFCKPKKFCCVKSCPLSDILNPGYLSSANYPFTFIIWTISYFFRVADLSGCNVLQRLSSTSHPLSNLHHATCVKTVHPQSNRREKKTSAPSQGKSN